MNLKKIKQFRKQIIFVRFLKKKKISNLIKYNLIQFRLFFWQKLLIASLTPLVCLFMEQYFKFLSGIPRDRVEGGG